MFQNISNSEIRGAFESLRKYTNRRFFALLVVIAIALGGVAVLVNRMSVPQAVVADYPDYSDEFSSVEGSLTTISTTVSLLDSRQENMGVDLSLLEARVTSLEVTPEPSPSPTLVPTSVVTDNVSQEVCTSVDTVIYLRYILEDEFPIPEDAPVEFVPVCNGDVALMWVEELGRGKVSHYYVFTGVDMDYIYFDEPGQSSSHEWRTPAAGDKGTLLGYGDLHGAVETQRWESDGVVDSVTVLQNREWTETEIALIELGNQFYNEAVDDGWFYFWYATDCGASEYRMNGQPIEPGPYGFTYKVPAEGGTFEAFYAQGRCGWYEQDTVRWSYEVHPGDAVVGTEEVSVFSMEDPDPWYFCGRLDRMRPVWQPEWLPYSLEDTCEELWGQDDKSTLATLAREGFLRADTRYGDDHAQDWVPFVFYGGSREVEYSWPGHEWVQVDSIELSVTDTFTVYLDAEYEAPIISYQGGSYESSSAFDSDIPWYGGWDSPIVFVPRENVQDSYFEWEITQVYRIRYVSGEIIIELAVWTPTE